MEEPKPEPTPEPTQAEKVEAEYTKIKGLNDRMAEELLRSQKLKAEIALGGDTGGRVEPVVKEETSKEYSDKVMSGEVRPK